MALPITQQITLAAADDDGICASQTPSAGPLLINGQLASGGVATLTPYRCGYGRQVLFTFAGTETGKTLTIIGTDGQGSTITEVVAGTGTTALSALMYSTITSIVISANAAAAIKVGTNGVGATRWFNLDNFADPFSTSVVAELISGTANFTGQITYDDILTVAAPVTFDMTEFSGGKAATTAGVITSPCIACRMQINSGTGLVTVRVVQAGLGGYG